MEKEKILVAVPTFETISPETFKSIYELETEHTLIFDYVKGYDCAKARNEIANKAINENCSYILMVDSDIVIPKNTIDCLLEQRVNLSVGVYPRKNTTCGDTELFKPTETDFTDRFTYSEINDICNKGFKRLQVKGTGLGCALIKTDILSQMSFPYFKFVTYDDGGVLSEDLYFCWQVNQLGIPIEADLRVRCGHMTRVFQFS